MLIKSKLGDFHFYYITNHCGIIKAGRTKVNETLKNVLKIGPKTLHGSNRSDPVLAVLNSRIMSLSMKYSTGYTNLNS